MFFNSNHIGQDTSDESLMIHIRKGNKIAFALLYERYFDKMVWYAYRFLQHTENAEDVVQEVFIKIIKQPEQFYINRTFSTWIYHVTANLCKNILRSQKHQQQTIVFADDVEESAMINSHHQTDMRYLQQLLQEKFDSLSDKEKTIFKLRFENQLAIKEIAQQMNIPEGSVKSGLYYMLKKYAPILNYYQYEL